MSAKKIYPEHDPFCIIYKLGSEHCNCVDDDEFGLITSDLKFVGKEKATNEKT